MLGIVDRVLQTVTRAFSWLSLPLALLLFAQWPLRDWLQAYSREANDLGQSLFALFVAASVVAATRARHHIATDVVSHRLSPRARALIERIALLVGVVPWALFVGWAAWPQIAASVRIAERYPDSANPGYFIVKAALALLVATMLAAALIDVFRADGRSRSDPT